VKGFRSPTARLLAGLALTLALVGATGYYALHQIAGLRELQSRMIDRNQKEALQLLRAQNDLNALGLAMRDMLSGDEPYPLSAWNAQFERIHQDINDAIRQENNPDSPEMQNSFRRKLAQFWISTDHMFELTRTGKDSEARALIINSLQPQQASLLTAASRLLVENNAAQQKTAETISAIYDSEENHTYWLLSSTLGAIAFTSLMLIHANRIVLQEMALLSEQRSGLARKLITMQEEMFRSISRELHDEFGQTLTAVGAMLSRARRQHCPPELTGDLEEIRAVAQEALQKTRSLTQTLHPSILDDGGLEEAIDWYLTVFEKQTGIHVELQKSGVSREAEEQLGDGRRIHVYRILQESLNNLAKHSRSIYAWVRLRFSSEALELEVEDRGVGLNGANRADSHGMGMVAMRERAQLLSGKIEFLRPESGGTLVRLHVPMHAAVKSQAAHRP
jgi:signal transduction histidine kinase